MTVSAEYDLNEKSTLFVMYNELCTLDYKNQRYKSLIINFNKLAVYFNSICSIFTQIQHTASIKDLQFAFDSTQVMADDAMKHLTQEDIKDIDNFLLSGKPDEYEKILLLNKQKNDAYRALTEKLMKYDANVSALAFFINALKFESQYNVENDRIFGKLYTNTNDYKKAIYYYEKYIKATKPNATIYNTLGALYSEFDKYNNIEKREYYFKKAIECDSKCDVAITNLAVTYRNDERCEEALEQYKKAMKIKKSQEACYNYSFVQLKLKNFKEGFKYINYRFNIGVKNNKINAPLLKKGISTEGKTILIQYEQGYGDSIMYGRYILGLKAKKIIFRVQDALVDLLKANWKNIEIIPQSMPIKDIEFDYYIQTFDLLKYLDARYETIPKLGKYILADEKLVKDYKKKYFDNDCLKIGISWHGFNLGVKYRNIPISTYFDLCKLKNVKVYSIQKDTGTDLENLPEGIEITDLGKTFNNFTETAAAIENLDLLISSDNVLANLAGAMGKKTCILLPQDADWRWFIKDTTTPWYDSCKLYRQNIRTGKSWDYLVNQIIKDEIEI